MFVIDRLVPLSSFIVLEIWNQIFNAFPGEKITHMNEVLEDGKLSSLKPHPVQLRHTERTTAG